MTLLSFRASKQRETGQFPAGYSGGLEDAPSKKEVAVMSKTIENKRVFSQPTMCLHCHLVVNMSHDTAEDARRGAWECPNCAHKYPFAHWKIKKQTRRNNAA